MKELVEKLILDSLEQLKRESILPNETDLSFTVERCKDPSHGDLASNVALVGAKVAQLPPRSLAEKVISALPKHQSITVIEIAGPGFINFKLADSAHLEVISKIFSAGDEFGAQIQTEPKHILIEFVSANPTGPLHVGHGRGAAFGSSLANLLEFTGHQVHREYYINDAGRQMDILAVSVWFRYLSEIGHSVPFPGNAYQGEYVVHIATELKQQLGDKLLRTKEEIFNEVAEDDEEAKIDGLIRNAKILLDSDYQIVFDAGLNAILEDIRLDLAEFRVAYDEWFSESQLAHGGAIDKCLQALKESDDIRERNGAWWFQSSAYGDEKDRVVIRDNGQPTYFASDIAYHQNKVDRHYDCLINIWGADHHGYIARVRAGMQALKLDPDALIIKLVQFAVLYRGKEKVPMSTRSGQFVTLRQLRQEVGTDAARFFYCMRSVEQHMDFDLELAKSQSNENPVYYVQYAHARICSVMRQAASQNLTWDKNVGMSHLDKLSEPQEMALLKRLDQFTELVQQASEQLEVHPVANYLRQLAGDLHTYYNAHTFIVEDEQLCQARLTLVQATRQVLKNGLTLLGVSQPESM